MRVFQCNQTILNPFPINYIYKLHGIHTISPQPCSTNKDYYGLPFIYVGKPKDHCCLYNESINVTNVTLHLRLDYYSTLDSVMLWLAPICEIENDWLQRAECLPIDFDWSITRLWLFPIQYLNKCKIFYFFKGVFVFFVYSTEMEKLIYCSY